MRPAACLLRGAWMTLGADIAHMPVHMQSLRILVDANVPAAADALSPFGSVRLVPGHAITRAETEHADVLIVRSVTRVDADLVEDTPVRFVGTATAGTDHVDAAALARLGIAFASAPGSNATSVVEYVLAALLDLADSRGADLPATLGVVGAGAVGGRFVPRARALGMNVLVCDPPRADAGHTDHDYRSLGDLLAGSDMLTLHVPLTSPSESRWPTRGLIGAEALAAMRPGAWLVNAARGGVVDGPALVDTRRSGRLGALVLDCWPGEPQPAPDLVAAANLATPHVAGYSFDGKVAGTAAVAAALRAWLAAGGDAPARWDAAGVLAEPAPLVVPAPPTDGRTAAAWLAAAMRPVVDVRADDARFRAAMAAAGDDAPARAAAFADLRRTHPRRREAAAWTLAGHVPDALRRAVTDGLGMRTGDGAAR